MWADPAPSIAAVDQWPPCVCVAVVLCPHPGPVSPASGVPIHLHSISLWVTLPLTTRLSRDPVITSPLGEAEVGRLLRILLWIVLNLGHLGSGLCPAVLVDNLIQTPAHSP